MNIVILGAGQVGSTLAQNLSTEHSVTVVDIDYDQLSILQNRLDIRTVRGSASDPKVLEEAGLNDADMLIAVTSSDDCNIVACQISYGLFKTPTKICRIKGNHLDEYPQLLKSGNLQIDTIINPAGLVTQRLVRQIEHPGTQSVLDFADGKINIASVRVSPSCQLCGCKMRELSHNLAGFKANIVGLLRNGKMILPQDDITIQPYDELYFCTDNKDLNKVTQALLQTELKFRRIMIAGAGNIGIALAKQLEKDYNVKILERSAKQCEIAAEALNQTIVLLGDAADTDLLKSENIDEIDLFCSITNDDEANIMSAILAKRLGAETAIALVNRQTYAHFLIERSPDIDMALSPQRITGGKILTYLRKGDIINVYPLTCGHAEALEVVVHGGEKTSKIVGKTIGEVKLPSDCKICAIAREGECLLAKDNIEILDGDQLIFFVADRSVMPNLEKILQVSPTFI